MGTEIPRLYISVLERFPEQAERIRLLLQQDANFAEICADYQKLALWLVAHDQESCISESECAANRLLLAELEIEILQFLQAVDHQPGYQA
jgi:tRNA A22 N-methylase